MKILREKRVASNKGILAVLFLSAIAVVLFWAAVGNAEGYADEQGAQALKANITKAVVSCYATEGSYPPSIDYLKENYGLVVDDSKYIVSYDIFASNFMPEIEIIKKSVFR